MKENDTSITSIQLPLLLSCLAGGSTSLGAAVVFCCQKISSSQLAFALSLAGSVMMTVSFHSILPECFQIETDDNDNHDSQRTDHYLTVWDILFWHRCLGLCTGALLYLWLAKCAFPEPNDIVFHSQYDYDESHNDKEMNHERESFELEFVEDTTEENNNNEKEQLIQLSIPIGATQSSTVTRASLITTAPTTTSTQSKPQQRLITPVTVKMSSVDDTNETNYYNKQYKQSTSFWHGTDLTNAHAQRSWRVALLLFVSLLVHNFPEGLAVAASTIHSPHLGITTTIAIALHNIPEGIAVAVPCLAARPHEPWMAFVLASASGLAEPIGAAVALWLLPHQNNKNNNNDHWMKNVLAFVAGTMIMVALRELFPEAWRHVQHQKRKTPFIWGTLSGVLVMLGSEAVLERAA